MTHGNVTGIPPSRGRKRGFPRWSPGTGELSRPVRGGSGRERSRDRSRRRGEWPGSDPWVVETREGREEGPSLMELQDWRAAFAHTRRARTRTRHPDTHQHPRTKTRGPVPVPASAQHHPCTQLRTHVHMQTYSPVLRCLDPYPSRTNSKICPPVPLHIKTSSDMCPP